jgi:hypothetical protein
MMRRSLGGWVEQRIVWAPLILLSLAVQVALFSPLLDRQPWVLAWGPWCWTAAVAAIAVALIRNTMAAAPPLRMPWVVASIGVCCNLLVVVANDGRMPQSASARLAVGRPITAEQMERLINTRPLTENSRLPALGDVIAQPGWMPGATTISIGDALLSAGAGWWAFAATRSR